MIVAVIPARYKSTRFPGKPLADIAGKPMIQWVYERVLQTGILDGVYVATDDQLIFDTVTNFGGKAVMTSPNHNCGSDRISECTTILGLAEDDIVLNIQGDEPLIKAEMVEKLAGTFDSKDVTMGTLIKSTTDVDEINDPNTVKVVFNNDGNALLFSRCPIPYNRDGLDNTVYYKHIGAYGYRKWFLDKFSLLPKGRIEQIESLEQMRVLENGYSIKVAEVAYDSVGVDTPEDLAKVRSIVTAGNCNN